MVRQTALDFSIKTFLLAKFAEIIRSPEHGGNKLFQTPVQTPMDKISFAVLIAAVLFLPLLFNFGYYGDFGNSGNLF